METLVLTPGVLSFCSHQRGRHAEHRRNLAPGNTVSRGQGPQAGLADLELRSFARGSVFREKGPSRPLLVKADRKEGVREEPPPSNKPVLQDSAASIASSSAKM